MPKKKNLHCLMLETKDKRRFFTYEKNYDQLVEFSQVFGGNISVVKVDEADVLDLAELVPAICNPAIHKRPQYELIKTKVKRKTVFQTADYVRSIIRKEFMSGRTVILKKMHRRFAKHNLSLSTICNHITSVRRELGRAGIEIVKTGGGKYFAMLPNDEPAGCQASR